MKITTTILKFNQETKNGDVFLPGSIISKPPNIPTITHAEWPDEFGDEIANLTLKDAAKVSKYLKTKEKK